MNNDEYYLSAICFPIFLESQALRLMPCFLATAMIAYSLLSGKI